MILEAIDDPDLETSKTVLSVTTDEKPEELLAVLKSVYLRIKPPSSIAKTSRRVACPPSEAESTSHESKAGDIDRHIREAVRDAFHYPNEVWSTFTPEQRQALLEHKNDAIAQAGNKPHKRARQGGKSHEKRTTHQHEVDTGGTKPPPL